MKAISRVLQGIGIILFVPGCGPAQDSVPPFENGAIVAGNGELPFDKQYNIDISLPMKESSFVALVKRLSLQYSIAGDLKKGLVIPNPRLRGKFTDGQIIRVYQVYGRINKNNKFGRIYRAFVDHNGDVVYIENAFEYPGL